MEVHSDAFASGQVGSKIWLCRHLEEQLPRYRAAGPEGYRIWIYGGWIGLLPFLLWSRQRLPVHRVVNFDLNLDSLDVSQRINDLWHWKGAYRSIQQDVSAMDFDRLAIEYAEPAPDVVINSAVEHMPDRRWFESLPQGQVVVLQSTDMDHADHSVRHESLSELQADYPLGCTFLGEKLFFDYNGPTSFSRYMTIGVK